MKNLIFLTFFLFVLSCNAQDKNKVLIKDFIEKVILNESYEINNIEEYVQLDKGVMDNYKAESYEILKLNIDNINQQIKDNVSEYKLYSHNESKNDSLIKVYNFIYDDYSNVYYLVLNDKVITTFVIKGDNIISFFPGLTKKRNRVYPWLLN